MPVFWDMVLLHLDPTVLKQHCVLLHIQGSQFFLDILNFEDQDTVSPENSGI
jgi:hypothetical protein